MLDNGRGYDGFREETFEYTPFVFVAFFVAFSTIKSCIEGYTSQSFDKSRRACGISAQEFQ